MVPLWLLLFDRRLSYYLKFNGALVAAFYLCFIYALLICTARKLFNNLLVMPPKRIVFL